MSQYVVIVDHTAEGGRLEAYGPYQTREKARSVYFKISDRLSENETETGSFQIDIAQLKQEN